MGQKIRPNSLRLGIIKGWRSAWFPKHLRFGPLLEEDVLIRKTIDEKIKNAGIDSVNIEKTGATYRIFIKAQRPGFIIGRGGKGVEELTRLLEERLAAFRKEKGSRGSVALSVTIEELKRSEVSAAVMAQTIAWDLERRMPFRRTIKKYLEQMLQNREVKGAKIQVAGRLDGGEIARTEHLEKGRMPLQTLRADIDYGTATAYTTYGTIGIKVWVYKGEVFEKEEQREMRYER